MGHAAASCPNNPAPAVGWTDRRTEPGEPVCTPLRSRGPARKGPHSIPHHPAEGEPTAQEHRALPHAPTNGEGSPCRITTTVSPTVLPAWRGCFLLEVFAALPVTG